MLDEEYNRYLGTSEHTEKFLRMGNDQSKKIANAKEGQADRKLIIGNTSNQMQNTQKEVSLPRLT